MLLLNGTLRPHEGELTVLGQSLDYSRSNLRWLHRKVGIVLQDPDDQLFGATVEQDVAFGPLNNGVASDEARELVMRTLRSLGIEHLAERPIHELSLGEKKRVALAGVLVLQPGFFWMSRRRGWITTASLPCCVCWAVCTRQERRS